MLVSMITIPSVMCSLVFRSLSCRLVVVLLRHQAPFAHEQAGLVLSSGLSSLWGGEGCSKLAVQASSMT